MERVLVRSHEQDRKAAMNHGQPKLNLQQGIPLAIGSVIGSGILFLPSATFKVSGDQVVYVWMLTVLMCAPLIPIFRKMVGSVSAESGMQGIVALGLGPRAAAGLPILVLGTVIFGMPASALVAGQFVQNYFDLPDIYKFLVGLLIIWIPALVNLRGLKASATFQTIASFLLLAMGVIIFCATVQGALPGYPALFPRPKPVPIANGILMAFWAFAGFENLLFMMADFKNPKRDLPGALAIALLTCGLIYIGLAANYAAIIPKSKVIVELGLYQLAQASQHPALLAPVIVMFAVFALSVNFNSWIWGISRLIQTAAKQGVLHRSLANVDKNLVPRKAILLFAITLTFNMALAIYNVDWFHLSLKLVSGNFVFMYCLMLGSFALFTAQQSTNRLLKLGVFLAVILLILFVLVLSAAGWLVLYPFVLLALGLISKSKGGSERCSAS